MENLTLFGFIDKGEKQPEKIPLGNKIKDFPVYQEPHFRQKPTEDPIQLQIWEQFPAPDDVKNLDNSILIDETGLEMNSWFKDYGLNGLCGDNKHCFKHASFRADENYLVLDCESDEYTHAENCQERGGCYGSEGRITDYLKLQKTLQEFKQANEGEGCFKGFSRIFMTQRAWAVSKTMIDRQIIIPDEIEGVSEKEKADNSIRKLQNENEFYRFDNMDNPAEFRDCDYSDLITFRFWITKVYGEESWKLEFNKAKIKAYKHLENAKLISVERYLQYCFDKYYSGKEDAEKLRNSHIVTAKQHYREYVFYFNANHCSHFKLFPESFEQIFQKIKNAKIADLQAGIKKLQEEVEHIVEIQVI